MQNQEIGNQQNQQNKETKEQQEQEQEQEQDNQDNNDEINDAAMTTAETVKSMDKRSCSALSLVRMQRK